MLIPNLDVSRRCASCVNYSRDGLPNFFCAIHPAGMGLDAGARNTCVDWQAADFSSILHAIASTLSTHLHRQGQTWRIVRLVQPPKQVMYAVVQVEQEIQIWSVYQWYPHNSTRPDPKVIVEEWTDFRRSIERDAPYVVWSDGIGVDPSVSPFSCRKLLEYQNARI